MKKLIPVMCYTSMLKLKNGHRHKARSTKSKTSKARMGYQDEKGLQFLPPVGNQDHWKEQMMERGYAF